MFAQYSWGQFALFALVLLGLYYLIVGFMYYRDEMGALFTRKQATAQLVGAPSGGNGFAGNAPLVRPASVFAPAPAAANAPADEPEVDVPLVTGSLPDSTAAATGQDEVTDDAVPHASAAVMQSEVDAELLQDAQREEELDIPDTGLAAAIARQTQAEADKSSENFTKPASEGETLPTFNSNSETEPSAAAYEENTSDAFEPMFIGFDTVPGTPNLDIATDVASLPSAASVAEYIASVRGQKSEAPSAASVPAPLAGTSLVDQMAGRQTENIAKLNNLFGPDDDDE